MAKILQKVFTSTDQVSQSFTVQSWHVSQSVDAFTGADDYDITISGSLTVIGPTVGSFTGSLQGTSSWANNATTASYILNAVSSSFASTASFVQNAQTASYVLNAVSASFASTASFVNPLNQSVILTGSLETTGSVTLRGLTTQSNSFLITINNSTGQLAYTSAVGLLASASQPTGPLNSYQFNNGGTFSGSSALTFSGGVVRGSGSFTGSFTGNLIGNATSATNAVNATNATNATSATNAVNSVNATNATNAVLATNVVGTANCILFNNGTNTTTTSTNFNIASNILTVNGTLRVTSTGVTVTGANNGWIYASGDVVADLTSDKRLKDNITLISNPIEKIQKIGGYEFDWIPTEDIHSYEGHDVGVIAQEIEEVLPELVTTRDNGYKAVKYEKIVALLIEAIKEQQKQIEELKFKIG
jgi:hypothetical protein